MIASFKESLIPIDQKRKEQIGIIRMAITNTALKEQIKNWALSLFLIPWAAYFLINYGKYTLLDHINLIIHEAGHFFFMFFGSLIHAAGGTLMQIIFPLFLAFYFLRHGYRPGVQLFIFWLGQNLINISVYAADANKLKLPILGNGKHDWLYMLGRFKLLESADMVGGIFFGLAVLVFIWAILTPLWFDRINPTVSDHLSRQSMAN